WPRRSASSCRSPTCRTWSSPAGWSRRPPRSPTPSWRTCATATPTRRSSARSRCTSGSVGCPPAARPVASGPSSPPPRRGGGEAVEVVTVPWPVAAGRLVPDILDGYVRAGATLGPATGSSPEPAYDELLRRHREEGLDFG